MDLLEQAKFNYGLIVVNLGDIDEDGNTSVIHFAGYYYDPTDEDVEKLRQELAEDETFGLTNEIDNLTISKAPEDIVEIYRDQYLEWIIRQN